MILENPSANRRFIFVSRLYCLDIESKRRVNSKFIRSLRAMLEAKQNKMSHLSFQMIILQ